MPINSKLRDQCGIRNNFSFKRYDRETQPRSYLNRRKPSCNQMSLAEEGHMFLTNLQSSGVIHTDSDSVVTTLPGAKPSGNIVEPQPWQKQTPNYWHHPVVRKALDALVKQFSIKGSPNDFKGFRWGRIFREEIYRSRGGSIGLTLHVPGALRAYDSPIDRLIHKKTGIAFLVKPFPNDIDHPVFSFLTDIYKNLIPSDGIVPALADENYLYELDMTRLGFSGCNEFEYEEDFEEKMDQAWSSIIEQLENNGYAHGDPDWRNFVIRFSSDYSDFQMVLVDLKHIDYTDS